MRERASTILTAVALVVIIGGGILAYKLLARGNAAAAPSPEPASTGSVSQVSERAKAPDFTVQNAKGDIVKLSDMLGKPVVLNFWASWCPPCKSEMPEFNKVYQDLGGSVEFMMVNATDGSRETKESGDTYVTTAGYVFPVYFDTNQDAVIKYSIRAIPTTFFIDSEGNIINAVEGAINENTLRSNIDAAKNAAAQPETSQKAEYHSITPEKAKNIMDNGDPYILVDVRTESEYKGGHIKNAKLIPNTEIADKAATELPDKNALIIVYCRSGARSAGAANALVKMGYTNVYDLGGIMNWPYETVTD